MSQDLRKKKTEQIWCELSDRLRQFVRSRVPTTTDVDDVLQSVFLRIHSRLDDLRRVDKLESWVFQITRNTISDYFRNRWTIQNNVGTAGETASEPIATSSNAEFAACLGTLIDRLPGDQRRAVTLYEIEGISQKEIAAREAISLSGAKSRIQRGRKTLETMLKACCEFQLDRHGNILDYEAKDAKGCAESCVPQIRIRPHPQSGRD